MRLADETSPPGGPEDSQEQPKKEATAVRAHGADVPAAVLAAPIAERAKLVFENAPEAQRLRPQQWSEVRKIAEAYGRAVGSARLLSEVARDSGLRAILVLLAARYPVADLEWVAANVPAQAWWRGGDRVRGLARLAVEVVSRALAERNAPPRAISPARNPDARAAKTGRFIETRCSTTPTQVDTALNQARGAQRGPSQRARRRARTA